MINKTSAAGPRNRIGDAVAEYGILAVLIFSPLPAASVPGWSMSAVQAVLLIMAAFYVVTAGKSQRDDRLSRSLKWPGRLSLAFAAFLFFQILPLPSFVVKILSPEAFARKNLYSGVSSSWMSLSMIPDRTLREGMSILSCFLFGFLIIMTVRRRAQILRMIGILIGMGIFEALYGLLELYNRNPRILFFKKIYNLDSVTGTFVNRNHFSAYLEMIIPLAIGLIIARMDLLSATGWRFRELILRFSEKAFMMNLFLFFGVLVMGLAVIFSRSRSGVVIFALIFLAFLGGTLLFRKQRGYQKKGAVVALQGLVVLILVISLYFGVNATLARFGMDKILREQRPVFWAETIRLFSAFPVFGTGLGTFTALYPGSEENGNPIHIYHAHNDYLEYLAELGVLGVVLLFGVVVSLLAISFRMWKTRRHPEARGLAFGGFVSVLAILFHSLTDFNMHIPANLILFSAVLSLTAVLSFYKKGNSGEQGRSAHSWRRRGGTA